MSTEPAPTPIRFPRPVPARAHLRAPLKLPDYLPARMLNEFVYCPRLFFYEWVEGVFAESGDTVEGALRHETIRGRESALPPAKESEEGKVHARSVTLSSEQLKLIAVIDLVEGTGTVVTPVDYKRGAPRIGEEGPQAWPADVAQVCAQALILRDNGYTCSEAILYYDSSRQRVRVKIDDELVAATLDQIDQARRVAERGLMPSPLVDSPKCPRCSLVSICLPDETTLSMGLPDLDGGQLGLFEEDCPSGSRPLEWPRDEEIRRLVPARDDLRPLYVTGQGLTVGKSGEVLRIRDRDGTVQEARLHDISQVNVIGNVSLTSGAVQALCWSGKPVAYFSAGHWFYGLTTGMGLRTCSCGGISSPVPPILSSARVLRATSWPPRFATSACCCSGATSSRPPTPSTYPIPRTIVRGPIEAKNWRPPRELQGCKLRV